MVDIPAQAIPHGFSVEPVGTHTSRTIMVSDLQALLAMCPADSSLQDYRAAVVDENVLGKRTLVTRRASVRYLRELYALDPAILLFRSLRDLWDADPASQPLLALLCAAARDPLLHATSSVIVDRDSTGELSAREMAQAVDKVFPGKYNPQIMSRIGRNIMSSWRQSGHVAAKPNKERRQTSGGIHASTYALLLGYLCGARGDGLFETLWIQLLDAPSHLVRDHAAAASRQGWLEYRHAGGVTEITFRRLLRDEGTP